MHSNKNDILEVNSNKKQTEAAYDRMSRFYDYIAGSFEKKHRNRGLEILNIKKGETVLEVGFGTGQGIKKIAQKVGKEGKVYGVDLSSEMYKITKNKLKKASLWDRVKISRQDALQMSYEKNKFDAVFMCFVLELFAISEIPVLLEKVKALLKKGGRLGIVSLSKGDNSLMIKIYETLHKKIPVYFDCRPIYVKESLMDAGYSIQTCIYDKMFALPVEIVVGINKS